MAWDTAREGAIKKPSRRGRLGEWENWVGSRFDWGSGKGEGERWRVPGAGEIEDEGGLARERPSNEGRGSIRPGGANGAREGGVGVWAISRMRAAGLGKAGQVNAMATGKEKPLGLSKLANLVTAVIPGQSAVAPRLRVNIEADGTGGIGGGG